MTMLFQFKLVIKETLCYKSSVSIFFVLPIPCRYPHQSSCLISICFFTDSICNSFLFSPFLCINPVLTLLRLCILCLFLFHALCSISSPPICLCIAFSSPEIDFGFHCLFSFHTSQESRSILLVVLYDVHYYFLRCRYFHLYVSLLWPLCHLELNPIEKIQAQITKICINP